MNLHWRTSIFASAFDGAKLHFHYSNHGLSILICIKGSLPYLLDCFLRSLIRLKDRIQQFGILPRNPKEVAMPVDSILVSAAVVSVFLIFAGVLIWGDFQTQPMR
jgi:hypothetical protein